MKAKIADPEKTSTAMQWHRKHVSAVTDNHITTKTLLKAVFSMPSMPRLYKENQMEFSVTQECGLVDVMG
jgi:hypothetical protein